MCDSKVLGSFITVTVHGVVFTRPVLLGFSAGHYTNLDRGVYACSYNWAFGTPRLGSIGVRGQFELLAGAGSAAAYTAYVASNPISWPAGVTDANHQAYPTPPAVSFGVNNKGAIYRDGVHYSGFPTVEMLPANPNPCPGKMC